MLKIQVMVLSITENQKASQRNAVRLSLWRRPDLNRRPSGYEPDELPTAPLRDLVAQR